MIRSLAGIVVLLTTPLAAAPAPTDPAARLEFNRDIRPILSANCFPCHGHDSASRKASLRLDDREDAVFMGAIDPGNPDDSELVFRIHSDDSNERMPPPKAKKFLSDEQKQVLIRWIEQGAEYQPHWSLIPPVRAELPEVSDEAWVRNPIDRFVLARLDAEGLQPAAEADRRTLARRVSLDLTGLPPDPELVEEFVGDTSEWAYDRLVDRLLSSPRWGEHRARYWLDAARYADTHGFHFDNEREMWSYRDWVINAFNANMPFDRFTIENLAGDLLPDATLEQRIGSGFNRCNMTTNEGGIIDEEYRVLYARDRVETTSQVWLGLTTGCAVCHDHKFDPLDQREFYQLAAFFNNTTQPVRDGNVRDTQPIVAVPLPEDRPRWDALGDEIGAAAAAVEERRETARVDFHEWLAAATTRSLAAALPQDEPYLCLPLDEGEGAVGHGVVDGQPVELSLAESAGWQPGPSGSALLTSGAACELEQAGDFETDQPFTCTAWIKLSASDGYAALCARMDDGNGYRGWDIWTQRRQVGTHVIHSWPEDGLKVMGKEQILADEWTHVAVSYDGTASAAGVRVFYNGVRQETSVENDKLAGTIRTEVPFKVGQRHIGSKLTGGVCDLRVYRRVLTSAEIESLAKQTRFAEILALPVAERRGEVADELYGFWLGMFDQPFRDRTARLEALEREQGEIRKRGTIAHVMQEADEAASAHVLKRGEYDQRLEQVFPATPAMLPPFPEELPRNRLGFARWLLLAEQPLTARVTVNRFWQELFGTGIVRTAGDFGAAAELPSHQELLDWLALEFRESGWDVKRLFRQMVMSATYRQSALATADKLVIDPRNRLLSRGPRFRMDAEMVRDAALFASGLLGDEIGGASVKPYQPDGVWEAIAMNVSNTREYVRDRGDRLYRRSLYWFWKRMAPPASMEILNAPSREICAVRRERTNTPLQALVTLNDEQLIEAARQLAQKALQARGEEDTDGALRFIALRLLARELDVDERQVVRRSLDRLLAEYREHPDLANALLEVGESRASESLDPIRLAAWTMLTNELMNLDEVLNK